MVRVRETIREDLKKIQSLWADGDVMKYVGFPDGLQYSDEEMERWFSRICANRPLNNHFSIFDDEKYCGESYYRIDQVHKSAALDIKLFGFARGRGIATAGLSHAIKEAFLNGAQSVWVDPVPANLKAIALYRKLGFKPKEFPEHLKTQDEEPGSIYMELCRNQYSSNL